MQTKVFDKKVIALLGQSQSFSRKELEELLLIDGITLLDRITPQTDLVVAGRLLNPLLEAEIEAHEKSASLEVLSLERFEQAVAETLFTEGLAMSLKLTNDNERCVSYLKNERLSDEVFLSLLPLFNWEGETLFGNDHNRDVCAALTRRFYSNVGQNHNIEYSPMGIYESVRQSESRAFLHTVANLSVLKQGFSAHEKAIEFLILKNIASNEHTALETFSYLLLNDDGRLAPIVAMSESLDDRTIDMLMQTDHFDVLLALSINPAVEIKYKKILLEHDEIAKHIAMHVSLDNELFELIKKKELHALGQNPTLSMDQLELLILEKEYWSALAQNEKLPLLMQQELFKEPSNHLHLASNQGTCSELLEKLFEHNKYELNCALANNASLPSSYLEKLALLEHEVVLGVAANTATPIEVLYQLHLDQRYNDAVKQNPSFGNAIKQEIGWET